MLLPLIFPSIIWKSPILPSVAVIVPLITNILFLGSKWNADELISMFWLAPLINWPPPPIKKAEELMLTAEPSNLINSPPAFPIKALGVPPLKSNCIPVFPNVELFTDITLFAESNSILEPSKVNPPSPTSNPPIEAETNLAKPCVFIEAEALASVDGEPSIVAGVLILLAVISPCTVKVSSENSKNWPLPLLPNNTAEPVILPSELSIKELSVDLIWVGFIINPPIEADLNVANPSRVILELALASVDGLPSIVAGVLILFAVIVPWTVNVSSTNCKNCPEDLSPNKTLLAETFPKGVKWNPLELISMLPPLPLINWLVSEPTKNVFASISNKFGFVLNLKEPLPWPPWSSKPTPS